MTPTQKTATGVNAAKSVRARPRTATPPPNAGTRIAVSTNRPPIQIAAAQRWAKSIATATARPKPVGCAKACPVTLKVAKRTAASRTAPRAPEFQVKRANSNTANPAIARKRRAVPHVVCMSVAATPLPTVPLAAADCTMTVGGQAAKIATVPAIVQRRASSTTPGNSASSLSSA